MAFESATRPFGASTGFEPGREYASPFGSAHPEVLGLGTLGEAAQQIGQFPVISGGGGGLPIPGLSQVEVNKGGPSTIGNETRDDTEGLLGGVARQTRIADETPPPAGPAQLTNLAIGAAQKGGAFAKDFSNLSAFSGGGMPALDFAAGEPGSQVSGGELGLDAPGAGTGAGGSSVTGTVGSGAGAIASLLALLQGSGQGGKDLGLAGGALGGVSQIAKLAALLNSGGSLGSLPGVTGGAGAISALLGLLASATGDPTLGTAAQASGIGTGVLNLANTGAGVGEVVSGLGGAEAAGAAAGGAEAAAAGGAAGLGTAAGAAFAPIAAMLISFSIANMLNPGSAPELSDLWTGGKVDPYLTFTKGLQANEGQQGTAFSTLEKGLPYVQSKEELGQLINMFKHYTATTTGIGLEDRSGSGDPYRLSAIPGVGPVTHGQQTPTQDWGPREQQLQSAVDALLTSLPGERITGGHGTPGGDLSTEAGMRLWTQFLDREQNAPTYIPADNPVQPGSQPGGEAGSFANADIPGAPAGFYGTADLSQFNAPNAVRYGQPGYDYAGSGFPEPGKTLGSISPAWLQFLLSQLGAQTNQTTAAAAGSPSNLPGLAQVRMA